MSGGSGGADSQPPAYDLSMIDLEPGNPEFDPIKAADARRRMPEPPPVKVLAIADVILLTTPGSEKFLDTLYLSVLRFDSDETAGKPRYAETFSSPSDAAERLPGKGLPPSTTKPGPRTYHGENFSVHYHPTATLTPQQLKLIQFQVPSLEEIVKRLLEYEISYERFRGITLGQLHLQLTDPAGHVIQIFESRQISL